MQTLLEYQQYKREQLGESGRRPASSDELNEVMNAAQTLIDASKDVKDIQ